MGILPDWMIERDVKIEPFAPQQHRPGVISYGLTSYGYDVRVDRRFKVFTNVYGSTVDPKNFDPKSFVDIEADFCIIPPNSFALAETIEYFDIPRDMLVVCLGKSTYARCFTGGTRVALVDGTSASFEEMAERAANGEAFWGYSLNEFGRIIVTELTAPRLVGRDNVVEITLDDGAVIEATPDHLFITRDGRSLEASLLRPGMSLMPLYRDLYRGYESVYQPLNGTMYPTHRLADEWNLRLGVYPDTPGTHRHHRDHDRRNNRPWNIERMPKGAPFFTPEAWRTVARGETPGLVGPTPLASRRDAGFDTLRHPSGVGTFSCANQGFRSLRSLIPGYSPPRLRREEPVAHRVRNHKVAAVRSLPGEHDVYCLTVPEAGNFALEAGVFVHNCGIIVNVTPLEPEWRGRVTIEISNTTPLPAKIYSGEGIAQMLFFRGEGVCRTSYADKKGKYQDQKGLTLPFVANEADVTETPSPPKRKRK